MLNTLVHFDALTSNGLKVIPLRPLSKIPVSKGWINWDKAECRELLARNPTYNIGLLLGQVIDVEGDTKEANDIVNQLIGDYNHPSYRSTKSVHHLFLNPDPDLTIVKYQDIEFRANRHQSVLPPSMLENGTRYSWNGPITFPIPAMPDRLLQFFLDVQSKKSYKRQAGLKPEHFKIPCFECKEDCYLHQKRFDLELLAFKELGLRWTCHFCRDVDVRPACRRIRKQGN